jgi:hypothetical protein
MSFIWNKEFLIRNKLFVNNEKRWKECLWDSFVSNIALVEQKKQNFFFVKLWVFYKLLLSSTKVSVKKQEHGVTTKKEEMKKYFMLFFQLHVS